MEIVIYIVAGLILGIAAGIFYARGKSQDAVRVKVDEEITKLRDETIEKTRRRVEQEVREDLADSVRRELTEKYSTEVRAEVRADAEAESKRILERGESKVESLVKAAELEAKSIVLEAQKEADQELKERRGEAREVEDRLTKREATQDLRAVKLDEREADNHRREEAALQAEKKLATREIQLVERESSITSTLEKIASFTVEEAKRDLIARMTGEATIEAARKVREIEEAAVEEADKRAQKVIAVAVQRYAGDYVAEKCVSVVALPSDDMKGRIIGREGRNIRALEAATGIDVIIDDTPEAVIISGFDPVRREIARLTLEKLISDGRIHPSRIEEVALKTEQEVAQIIKEYGEKAAFELGIHGLHPEIIKLLGRLKYRTSYGQNMWAHSIEVGFLCGLMASELGVNVKLARRAGLLHDMGKALTHEQDGSHAVIGAEIARKHGEHEIVRNAIGAHHNDEPQNSVIAHLVIAADALSGARPGARREILETYVKRLEDLERISMGFDGVEKTYAIQAGREIRVMVEHSNVSDDQAYVLSREIARKIENEMTYPGQIKVCVIRETRAIDYAK
ncbi:MAG: ribonuclease Y [Bradymonadaceae bacterium]|nr:ribonuclease Y [Lujinxingiaceae bacterium]